MTITFPCQTAFVFVLIFARMGSMVMAMPAFGDGHVPSRMQTGFRAGPDPSSCCRWYAKPMAHPGQPSAPCWWQMLSEIIIGVFIGLSARMLTSAIHVAGTVIAFQSGLAFAQNVDPTQGTQSAIIGTFMALLATTLIFSLDLHFLLLAALRDSYDLFQPGRSCRSAISARWRCISCPARSVSAFSLPHRFWCSGWCSIWGLGCCRG